MPMNSGAPGTPNLTAAKVCFIFAFCILNMGISFNSLSLVRPLQDGSGRLKIVVALYPFKAIEAGDLSLEKVINLRVNCIISPFFLCSQARNRIWSINEQFSSLILECRI